MTVGPPLVGRKRLCVSDVPCYQFQICSSGGLFFRLILFALGRFASQREHLILVTLQVWFMIVSAWLKAFLFVISCMLIDFAMLLLTSCPSLLTFFYERFWLEESPYLIPSFVSANVSHLSSG